MFKDAKKMLPICLELILLMPRASKKLTSNIPMAWRSFIAAYCLLPVSFWTLTVHPLLFSAGAEQPSLWLISMTSALAHIISALLIYAMVYGFVRGFSLAAEFPRFVTQINWLGFIFAIWALFIYMLEYLAVIDFQFAEDIFVVTQVYGAVVFAICFHGTFRLDWVWGGFFAAIAIILGDAVQDIFYALIQVDTVDYAEFFTTEK